jgi:hypothetical protein
LVVPLGTETVSLPEARLAPAKEPAPIWVAMAVGAVPEKVIVMEVGLPPPPPQRPQEEVPPEPPPQPPNASRRRTADKDTRTEERKAGGVILAFLILKCDFGVVRGSK